MSVVAEVAEWNEETPLGVIKSDLAACYFSFLHILKRDTLQPEWMQDSCIKVIRSGFFFPPLQGSLLTFHLEVCYLLVYTTIL